MTDQEQMKYHAAREIWKKRDQLTSTGITWRSWWEHKFNDNLQDYAKRMAA